MAYLTDLFFELYSLVASVLEFILSVTNALFWNRRYYSKRREKRSLIRAFMKTVLFYAGTGLVLNNVLLVFTGGFSALGTITLKLYLTHEKILSVCEKMIFRSINVPRKALQSVIANVLAVVIAIGISFVFSKKVFHLKK